MTGGRPGVQPAARWRRLQTRHVQARTATWPLGYGGCPAYSQRVLHTVGPPRLRDKHPEIVATARPLYREGAAAEVSRAMVRADRVRRTGTTPCPVCGDQTPQALSAIHLHVKHPDPPIQPAVQKGATMTEPIRHLLATDPARWLQPLPDQLPDVPPLSGLVPLDPVAADLYGADRIDFDDPAERHPFTAVLVSVGLPATIHTYLSANQLTADWPHLELTGPVRDRWQSRFPHLK